MSFSHPFEKKNKEIKNNCNWNSVKKDMTRENVKKQLINALDFKSDNNCKFSSEYLALEIEEEIYKQNDNNSKSKDYRDKIRKIELRIKGNRNLFIREILKKGLISVKDFCKLDEKILNDDNYFRKLNGDNLITNNNDNNIFTHLNKTLKFPIRNVRPPIKNNPIIQNKQNELISNKNENNNFGIKNNKNEKKIEFSIKENQFNINDNINNTVIEKSIDFDITTSTYNKLNESEINTYSFNINDSSVSIESTGIKKHESQYEKLKRLMEERRKKKLNKKSKTLTVIPNIIYNENNNDNNITERDNKENKKDNELNNLNNSIKQENKALNKGKIINLKNSIQKKKINPLNQNKINIKENIENNQENNIIDKKTNINFISDKTPNKKIKLSEEKKEEENSPKIHFNINNTSFQKIIYKEEPEINLNITSELSSKRDFFSPKHSIFQNQYDNINQSAILPHLNLNCSYIENPLNNLKEKYKLINEQKIVIETELNIIKKENDQYKKEIANLKEIVSNLKQQISQPNEEILRLEQIKFNQKLKQKEVEIEILTNENIQLKNHLKICENNLNDMIKDNKLFREEMEKRCSSYQKEIETLRQSNTQNNSHLYNSNIINSNYENNDNIKKVRSQSFSLIQNDFDKKEIKNENGQIKNNNEEISNGNNKYIEKEEEKKYSHSISKIPTFSDFPIEGNQKNIFENNNINKIKEDNNNSNKYEIKNPFEVNKNRNLFKEEINNEINEEKKEEKIFTLKKPYIKKKNILNTMKQENKTSKNILSKTTIIQHSQINPFEEEDNENELENVFSNNLIKTNNKKNINNSRNKTINNNINNNQTSKFLQKKQSPNIIINENEKESNLKNIFNTDNNELNSIFD